MKNINQGIRKITTTELKDPSTVSFYSRPSQTSCAIPLSIVDGPAGSLQLNQKLPIEQSHSLIQSINQSNFQN